MADSKALAKTETDDASADEFARQLEAIAVDIEVTQTGAIFRIGQRLMEARKLHKGKNYPGGFEGWIEDRLSFTKTTAYSMIQVTEKLGQKGPEFGTLSMSALIETARGDDDVQDAIAKAIKKGELVTAERAREIRLEAAQEAAERFQKIIDEAQDRIEELDASKADDAAEIDRLKGIIQKNQQAADAAKKKLPKPAEASKLARESGRAVLGSDMKYHTGASPAELNASGAYVAFHALVARLGREHDPVKVIIAGCPEKARSVLRKDCEQVVEFINEIAEALQ